MEIVIEIPDEVYNFTIQRGHLPYGVNIAGSIIDGTVLPKGHGDLIDRDILLQNWKVIPSRDRLIFDRYIQILNGVIPADKESKDAGSN